jgi:DNA-binding transcriptional MocR family regulator
MSLRRRRHLVELANRYDVIILEDGPYRETRFEGTSPPTIKSLDTEGRVIYLGSFSKILAPGCDSAGPWHRNTSSSNSVC